MKIKLFVVLYLIFYYYLWTISHGTPIHLDTKNTCFYNYLSEGFLSGMLNLSIDPKPELLALPDPYDPNANAPYRLHDATLYKGKYYSYFGPTPVILLYAPCMLLSKMYMGDHIAVLIFCFGGLLWGTATLFYLQKQFFQNIPNWMILVSVSVLGLANFALFNLRRTEMYEVAISCAMFLLMGAIYFICRSFESNKPKLWMLAAGSLFIGLAVGARPHALFSGVLLLISYLNIYRNKNLEGSFKIKSFIALFLPYGIMLALLGLYNFLRFDNPFDFGNKYQLAGMNMKLFKVLDIECLIPGSYLYLFLPPKINSVFPFFHMDTVLPDNLRPRVPYFIEKVIGVLPSIPFLLLLFIFPITYWLVKIKSCKEVCLKNLILQYSTISIIAFSLIINLSIFLFQPLKHFSFFDVVITVFERLVNLPIKAVAPLFIIALLINIIIWMWKANTKCLTCYKMNPFPKFEFLIISLPGFINLFFILSTRGVTMRYIQDFSSYLILANAVVWFYFIQMEFSPNIKKILNGFAITTATLSIIMGMAFGIVGCYVGLSEQNPEEYNRLVSDFSIISDFIHSIAPMWGQY